jgi:hypothetical protein
VPSVDERIVAVLHDQIIEALQSVTKSEGEDYEDFVRRAAANPIGRAVKLADMLDNIDLSRIAVPSEKDFQRIMKYLRGIDLIRRLPA